MLTLKSKAKIQHVIVWIILWWELSYLSYLGLSGTRLAWPELYQLCQPRIEILAPGGQTHSSRLNPLLHVHQILSNHPGNANSIIDKLLKFIASKPFLAWGLALVMVHKEQDIVLRSILQLRIYDQFLWYVVSALNVNWDAVTPAGGVIT